MKLVFIGADHEVTGSCHYMEVGDKKILRGHWYGAGAGFV